MNERKNLTIMDYFALYQMSLRSFFWRVDGRQMVTRMGNDFLSLVLCWRCTYVQLSYTNTYFMDFGNYSKINC